MKVATRTASTTWSWSSSKERHWQTARERVSAPGTSAEVRNRNLRRAREGAQDGSDPSRSEAGQCHANENCNEVEGLWPGQDDHGKRSTGFQPDHDDFWRIGRAAADCD